MHQQYTSAFRSQPARTTVPQRSLPRGANTCRVPHITICNIIGCYVGMNDRTPSPSSSSSSSSAHALRQTHDSHGANPPLQRELSCVKQDDGLTSCMLRQKLRHSPAVRPPVQPPLASTSAARAGLCVHCLRFVSGRWALSFFIRRSERTLRVSLSPPPAVLRAATRYFLTHLYSDKPRPPEAAP